MRKLFLSDFGAVKVIMTVAVPRFKSLFFSMDCDVGEMVTRVGIRQRLRFWVRF